MVATERQGFSLLETVIGMGILVIASSSLYLIYSTTLDIVTAGQYHSAAANIIESELEIVRNMRYEDIGTVGGVPSGKLEPEKVIVLDETGFTVKTFVRNVDDPFDGTLGGDPEDTDPADYKLVELHIECQTCPRFGLVQMTTTISPYNLESTDRTGNLIVQSLNALGQPLPGATVTIINNNVSPPVDQTDTTDVNGQLELVGMATSSAGYRITVTKSGHSTDRTYPPGDPSNPNPIKPDVTIAQEQLTIASFAIDETVSLTVQAVDQLCVPISGMDMILTSSKLIGSEPDVPNYSQNHSTEAGGAIQVAGLEWDAYTLRSIDATYNVAATGNSSPITLDPGQDVTAIWLVEAITTPALLVTVTDQNGQPVDDAAVQVSSGTYDQTLTTGQRTWTQTDWSDGQYTQKSDDINTATAGVLALVGSGGSYASGSYEWLESETIDFGASGTSFFDISWGPSSQPPQAGAESVRMQVAANNGGSTWSYVGPDGTSNTYFTSPDTAAHSTLSGNRYLRYRVELRTLDANYTPTTEDVSLSFRSSCWPGGGTSFGNIPAGTYTLNVTAPGFENFTETDVSVLANWQEHPVSLTPQ
jgi:hypothetical protein